jgi:four helix bundle protein
MLDHEKLDVYQLELEFVSWVTALMDEVRNDQAAKVRSVFDHLDRASLSVLLNTAEGNGKRQRGTRGKFFDDARGSATECSACLDALMAKGVCPPDRVADGKAMLVRIVSMLTRLVARYSNTGVREDEPEHDTCVPTRTENDDDEDEDEPHDDEEDAGN